MKKLLIPIITIAIISVIVITVNIIDWGKLTINIMKKTTGYDITYEILEGNLLKGYILQNYVIKISPNDSIYGKRAQISYRLSPLRFRLPTIFQINLLEPNIYIKAKKTTGETGKLIIPAINLSLRINVKNGKLIYENAKLYEVDHISGLIFIDFLGKNFYITTMNLSLSSPTYPITIYSANIFANIGPDEFDIKSFQIKGKELTLQGSGLYLSNQNSLLLKVQTGKIDFGQTGMLKGKINFSGEIRFAHNRWAPIVQGTVQQFYVFENFNFESNLLGDTIILNLFNGQALGGNFSAQVKLLDFKDYTIETNFRNIDIAPYFKLNNPVLVNGKLGFKEQKFFGVINSPKENGMAIESLYVNGTFQKNKIFIDTLIINEDDFMLGARGMAYPDVELSFNVHRLNLERLNNFYPFKGIVYGNLNLKGRFNELINTSIDADMGLNDFVTGGLRIKHSKIKLEKFFWKKGVENLNVHIDSFYLKDYSLDNISLNINRNTFRVNAHNSCDTLLLSGNLNGDFSGRIESFQLTYHQAHITNIEPIDFDILNRKLGLFRLRFAEGEICASINDGQFSLVNINLEELSKFFGNKEKIRGKLNLKLENNILSLGADSVFYRGLNNGKILIGGDYLKNRVKINKLTIADDDHQSLIAQGMLSFENSRINLKFENVRPWVFPFLSTFMESPEGLINGEIEFEGNLREFKLTGQAEIENARFGINVISARFDSGYAKVKFRENQIIFESMKAQAYSSSLLHSGTRSWATGGGIIKLEPMFRVRNLYFDFSFQEAPLQYQNYAYGIGSGNFAVSMKDEVMFYNGNINIKEAIIPVEFGTYLESASGEEKEWHMNLKLSGERNIWLRNRDVDIEFGGEVYVIKEQTPLYVSGILETRRGNYYWLNHILRITSGKVTFMPQEVIDPELDFTAELDTRERDPNTNQAIKIILHCTGSISEPVLEFFSDPPLYNEQDILTYMNLNITWKEFESMKQGEYVGRVLPQSILAWLESDVSRRLRAYTGLDYFRIEAPIFESEEKTKVTVGKYVSRNLFVTYTYDITSYSNEFNVEYFIDDRNEILIKRDNTGEYQLQYQYRIRF
ncbi:MAG: translocation/assembly module TamB domain-containing protein [bacterium]